MSPQDHFAAALRDTSRPIPPGLKTWNGSDPAQRFAVHRNNVRVALVDALAGTFPVTRCLVGDDFFRAMAAVYATQHLPRSRVVALYGDTLPEFIDAFEPAATLPWLGDVARLEHARVQACHAADAEPVLARHVSQALALGEALADVRLGLHPSVRLLRSAHAVATVWAAHQTEDGEPEPFDPDGPEDVLVVRPSLDVQVLRLPPGAAAFLAAAGQGSPFGDAAAAALADAPAFDLPTTLGLLLVQGVITDLILPEETP
ncbi:HvfC/BufC N-terminal domain-containing protein [Leptothrix discophora]|uniref:DNA-binding domain-containing protein n=1 Tax=Leptothrix discophora TaxID=89 RepID=A0ABT9G046_LEPDI|nr:DNA-binding domain-containing protein [Leptothrix discophora]MDP4299672.1 DNA-binding domain-containing protein [Leptothrix discophora]